MNNTLKYILVMALVTYAVRMIPFVLFRKKITSRFVRSFLFYIPYAVLSAMIIPDVFFSAGGESIASAAAGFAVAVILSFLEKSLLTVAVSAVVTVYIAAWVLRFM